MPAIARLSADLTANTSSFEMGMRRAESTLSRTKQRFQRDLSTISGQFSSLAGSIIGINGAMAGLVGGGGLVFLASNALNAADAIAKLADRLGLTTTEFQRYEYAAKLSGVTTEQLETSIGFLNRQIAEGKLPYKTTGEALLALADKTVAAKDGIERAGIATEAFGSRGGARLIPFLQQGRVGIQALGDEAQRLGVVLNEDTIRGAEGFKDQLEALALVISRNFQQGILDGFIGESQTIRDIYTDPQFAQSVRDIGAAFGEAAGAIVKMVAAYRDMKLEIAKFSIDVRSRFNKDSPFAVDPEIAALAMQDASGLQNGGGSIPAIQKPQGGQGSGGGFVSFADQVKTAKERAKALQEINNQLTRESVLIDSQIQNYGQKDSLIKSAIEAKKIELSLAEKGIVLTDKEKEQIQAKLDLLKQNQEELEKLNEHQKALDDAAQQLGFTFKSAFEDAIIEGKSFRDVLKSIVDDIFRIFLRMQVTGPAGNALSGLFGGGGGSLFGNLFGGLSQGFGFATSAAGTYGPFPSFDVGTDYVTSDMTANIHRGEAVLAPDDAAAWRAGEMGGTGSKYYIDATGASRQSVAELKALIMALAGPGKVEDRVMNARRRGQL